MAKPSTPAVLSAGAVLAASRSTANDIRRAIAAGVNRTEAEARRREQTGDAIAIAILIGSQVMAESTKKAIVVGRQRARASSVVRLAAEIRSVGLPPAKNLGRGTSARIKRDQDRAQVAADSLADQWRQVAGAGTSGGSPYRANAFDEAAASMRARGDRTATTESAQAFSEEHLAAISDAVEAGDTFADAAARVVVLREWVALVEACWRCSPMHGKTAMLNGDFEGGIEPGEVHPRCMCSWILSVA